MQSLAQRHDADLNVLTSLQPLADGPQVLGEVRVHEFIRETGRGIERAEFADAVGCVARFFLQFANGGAIGRLALLKFARGELPEPIIHGNAVVAYHDHVVGVQNGHDDHRARMPHDLAAHGAAILIGPRQRLDLEQRSLMDGFDATTVIHQDDDTSSPDGRAPMNGEVLPPGDSARAPDAVAAARGAIVQLKNIHKSFGHQRVLRGMTLDFQTGKTTVVLGPSGCGKSVMLKHIVGLLRPDIGEVYFDGQRIDHQRESRLGEVRRQVGFLFQMGALFDSMSVRDNVAFPLTEHTRLSAEDVNRRVLRVLQMVGLEDAVKKMPADLSGGQRKRIALARAIILEPKVILYDEPTTGLDPIRSDVINELILKLQRELKLTSIIVTHDLASAFKVADYTVMMHEGKILFCGTPDELKASDDPVVQRFLRGEASEDELKGIRAMRNSAASSSKAAR